MGRRLYVGNLAWTVTDQDLLDVFSEAGKVDSSQVIIDRATNRSRDSASLIWRPMRRPKARSRNRTAATSKDVRSASTKLRPAAVEVEPAAVANAAANEAFDQTS